MAFKKEYDQINLNYTITSKIFVSERVGFEIEKAFHPFEYVPIEIDMPNGYYSDVDACCC